jgi:hypothetical protein
MICEIKRGTSSYSADDNRRIGLNALLQKYGFPLHPLKNEIHTRMDKTGSDFWAIRPLTKDLIVFPCHSFDRINFDLYYQYMVYDVTSLIPLMVKLQGDLQLWPQRSVHELSYIYSRIHIENDGTPFLFLHCISPYLEHIEPKSSPTPNCLLELTFTANFQGEYPYA